MTLASSYSDLLNCDIFVNEKKKEENVGKLRMYNKYTHSKYIWNNVS